MPSTLLSMVFVTVCVSEWVNRYLRCTRCPVNPVRMAVSPVSRLHLSELYVALALIGK